MTGESMKERRSEVTKEQRQRKRKKVINEEMVGPAFWQPKKKYIYTEKRV